MVLSKATNILIAGVGGQGNRTLMRIIALAALADNKEVRVQSSASLGRLGGSITCHIRLGPSASASIPVGEVDILVALEMNEALRAIPMMRRGALAFIHTYRRIPIVASIHGVKYPSVQEIEKAGTDKAIKSIFLPEDILSFDNDLQKRYFIKPANIVMLGTFCSYTQILPRHLVEQSLSQYLPSDCALQNLRAFATGWRHGEREATR
jgi:indolepyruvate ferredoxin oxidoreductase beta subunit